MRPLKKSTITSALAQANAGELLDAIRERRQQDRDMFIENGDHYSRKAAILRQFRVSADMSGPRRILALLSRDKDVRYTTSEIAQATDLAEQSARMYLSRLVTARKVERSVHGGGKGVRSLFCAL